MPIIDFKATMCKHCYKCVRGCEVKSIMIRDGHAYIMPNRCILCGQCLLNCPQSAKRVPSELSKVKKLIESGAPVIASLSSSYMGVLPYKKRGQVKSALKKLGFANVCDAAEGAALATEEYVRLLEQGEMKNIITTACPSIVNLIEIHYPELIKYLAPVLIPSGIHTRMLHAEFGEAAKVVVIGPCIAEKEKNRVVKPDAVLTFEDLKQWLSEEQIEIEACEEEPFEDREPGANLRYPVSGGLLTAVTATQKKPDKYRKFYVSGVKDCLDVCEAMKTGEVAGCFIEMNACHGGCVNGPSTATSVSSFKVKLDLEAMLPKEPADLSLMHEAARQVEIHRTFVDRSQKERIPTEEEIREILKKTGKMTPEQELNCGACGYPTCREKAIAVFQKKAEVDMCIPYLHDRAQSLSHLVMDTSPNLIMIIDDDMRIQECSVAAEMYFGVKPEAIKGKPLEDFINAEDVREVFRTHTSVHSRKVIYPDRNLVTLQNIAYIDDGNFVIATIIDVTREEKQAKQEYAKKKATIDLAQNVIYKQMMVAQNIAGLLGETTAETKTTLMKLLQKELDVTSGQIIVNGQDYKKLTQRNLPKFRRQMGMVFQDFRLLKDRTIFENVAFAQQVVEVPHRYIKRQVENMLEMVGLKDRMNAFPNELSGGEQQRVAIARALVNHPVLLLADEPTGNLDPVTAKGIMELLSEINKSGTTVLVVTHNKELVNEMGKRVILIEDGHIEQDEIRGSYDI